MDPKLTRTALDPVLWQERSVSTAYRLLCGLGQAELVSYHASPMFTLTAVAHGVTRSGDLVVAVSANDPALGDELPTDIRLSIDKQAPRLDVHIVASSAHLLGQARWLETAEKALVIPELPQRVAMLAESGYLAVITYDRVLLHDVCGVTPLCADVILDEHERCQLIQDESFFCELEPDLFVYPEHEISTVETVNSELDLQAVYDGLMLGEVTGAFLACQELQDSCEHILGATCLDVDRTGITLMSIEREGATTAFVPFKHPVSTRPDVIREVRQLGK
ncbi:hypothetical protein [Ancrocorticia populi]|uniref:Uncharacterized protein n=1 Tax=Ancrocorticia populi TaxID=2175228 RepID=A0A2V1KDE5_9ACTO|nr:hypothetical protein [Ancrocorticia populi]PWF27661.1 hypothetical protein DD236_04605 [Ancrocorticia populi]